MPEFPLFMVKQRQIAEKLGVSINTVSRALRNHPDLSEDTKERIRKIASEMGYGRIGRAPSSQAPVKRIGILFYKEDQTNLLNSEVHRTIFLAIEEECQKIQVETLFQSPAIGEVPLCIKNRTVDGLLLFGRYTEEAVGFIKNFPTLSISSYPSQSNIPCITADNSGGIYALTESLIRQGHSRILYLCPPEDHRTQIFQERSNGYLLAMLRNNLEPQLHYGKSAEDTVPPEKVLKAYTAVVCANDSTGSPNDSLSPVQKSTKSF